MVANVEAPKAFGKDLVRSAPLTLRKGRNELIMSVDNKANPSQICARFLDKEGKPVRAIVNDSSPR